MSDSYRVTRAAGYQNMTAEPAKRLYARHRKELTVGMKIWRT
jgi:hypothetical protein